MSLSSYVRRRFLGRIGSFAPIWRRKRCDYLDKSSPYRSAPPILFKTCCRSLCVCRSSWRAGKSGKWLKIPPCLRDLRASFSLSVSDVCQEEENLARRPRCSRRDGQIWSFILLSVRVLFELKSVD